MRSLLFITGLLLVKGQPGIDQVPLWESTKYTDFPNFNNPGALYPIQGTDWGNGVIDGQYSTFQGCARLNYLGNVKNDGTGSDGFKCSAKTNPLRANDQGIDDKLDQLCQQTYGTPQTIVRNLRGEESNAFYYGNQLIYRNNIEQTPASFLSYMPNGWAPACNTEGGYCGGSCGRYPNGRTSRGKRICMNKAKSANCFEIPPNGIFDDYDNQRGAPDGRYYNTPAGSNQPGKILCGMQLTAETNLVWAMCVSCQIGSTEDPPLGLPCKKIVVGGVEETLTIPILPVANGLTIRNAIPACDFDSVPEDPCEISFVPGDPPAADGKIIINYTPAADGNSGIHQFVSCDVTSPAGTVDEVETIFVVRNLQQNGQVVTIGGCDNVRFRDPVSGTIIVSVPPTPADVLAGVPIPSFNNIGGGINYGVAVQCIPTGGEFSVGCSTFP